MPVTRLKSANAIALLLGTTLVASLLGGTPAPATVDSRPADTVRMLLELDEAPALTGPSNLRSATGLRQAQAREQAVRESHQGVASRAVDVGIDLGVVHHLSAAFNGMVVDVPRSQVDELRQLPGVRAVHADTSFQLTLDTSVPHVGAPEVWRRTDPGGQPADGAGITVAVVDSGVDYTHPDLGGGFGPGHKVVAGHDFANGDDDPMDDLGHGTHVAGTVAGNGRVKGVAPGARLTAYKVTNEFGSARLTDVIAGLDAAVAPSNEYRADVVNLSLSGPGDGTDPLSQAAERAVAAGAVVVASAGNSGPVVQTVNSPAAAPNVLAVGASITGIQVPTATMIAPVRQPLHGFRLAYSANPPEEPSQIEVVDVGYCTPEELEQADMAGKAVLCHLIAGVDELQIALAVEQAGAVAVFFYVGDTWGNLGTASRARSEHALGSTAEPRNHAFTTGLVDDRLEELIAMFVPGASVATLQHHLARGTVRVELASADATDQLADFSSRGPTGRFAAKPNLLAPGVEILSTVPNGSHLRASGTSMAAPHVAGAAALVRQLHPTWTAGQVSGALAGSARKQADPVLAQGSGVLDVPAAADARVIADPMAISLGAADLSRDRITRTAALRLWNVHSAGISASLSVERADGLDASVSIEPSSATVAAGKNLTAQLGISLPTPSVDGDVSGWVKVDVGRDGTTDLRVPFLLAVRHLSVSATPDPAPEDTQATVFVRSPADLATTPTLDVRCPGLPAQRPVLQLVSTRYWKAVVRVDKPGVCRIGTTGRYGSVTLTGDASFEVAEEPDDSGGSWQPIGPNATAGRMVFGASSDRMAVVPLDSGRVFVTEDRMRTWRELRTMPMAGGTAVAVEPDPLDGDGMYVAVNGRTGGDASYEGRVVHSSDGGESWRILPGPDAQLTTMALDGGGRTLAVAEYSGGVRVSSDRGTTWTTLPKTWTTVYDLHWIGADLYLGTNRGLNVIRNAAAGGPDGVKDVFRPGPLGRADKVAGDAETIIVTGALFPYLYLSRDGGATFQQVMNTTGISFFDVELVGDTIYALQGSGALWVGPDRGARWETWGDPMRSAVEFDVGRWPSSNPAPTDGVHIASNLAGLYAADGPDQFRRTGVPGAHVHDLALTGPPGGTALIAGTAVGAYRTEPPRSSSVGAEDLDWGDSGHEGFVRGERAQFLGVSRTDPNVVYRVMAGGLIDFRIERSDDGGKTWQVKSRPSEVPTSLLVHPADPRRVYVGVWSLTGLGLVESLDGGETWRRIDLGHNFLALAGDPRDADRIWAGDLTGLYRSDDGGVTFDQLSEVAVSAIAVDPDDPDNLVVGGRRLYTSDDGGRSLHAAGDGALDMWVTDLVFEPGRGDTVYAASSSFYDELGALKHGRGVLRSDNDGRTWRNIGGGLDNPNVTSLAIDQDRGYLYAGTFGGSVHRLRLPR